MNGEEHQDPALNRIAQWSLFITLCANLAFLIGWSVGSTLLTGIRQQYIPIAPITALCFALLSSSFLGYALHPHSRIRQRVAASCGFIVFVISTILLIDFPLGIRFEAERLGFDPGGYVGIVPAGHMGPLTALLFIVASMGILMQVIPAIKKRRQNTAPFFAAAVTLTGAVMILGYLYGTPFLYGGSVIPIAIPTAVSFVFLGLGLLTASGPQAWPVRYFMGQSVRSRLMRALFPSVLAVVFLGDVLEYYLLPTANYALISSGIAFLMAIILGIIVSEIAKSLGSEIDNANRERDVQIETIKASEERHRTILQTAMDGVWRLDQQGRLLEVNDAYCRMSGYSARELLSMDISDLDAAETAGQPSAHLRKIMERGKDHFESRHRRKDGTIFDVEVSVQYRPADDGQFVAFLHDITKRKQVEKVLRDGERKYRELVDFLPISIFETNSEGRVITLNRTASVLFGLIHDDLARGINIRQLVPPEDLEKIKDNFSKPPVENARTHGEYTLSKMDGGEFPVLLFFAPIAQEGRITGLRCAVIDMTEIKWAQEACRISEEKYRSIYEHALEGIYQITPDGRFLSANPALTRMLGFETAHEMMTTITDVTRQLFVHPERRQVLVDLFKEEGTVDGFEFEAYRRDGNVIWISINAHAVKNKDGEILYHEGTMEDITRRKEMEEQLRRAYQVLHETNDRLIETDKLAAVGTLAAGVAHEILNPVNIIATGIAALEGTQSLSEPVTEAFAIFRRQIDRVVGITRDLQQFSRRSAGNAELTDVRELIRYTLSLCEPRLKVENVLLEIDADDAMPEIVMDRNRMEQVFLNIINNAVDAMAGKDKKVLRISAQGIPGPGISAPRVLIAISDVGHGIRDENLNRIFDPFFTTKKVGKGTGLGLSISHNIVQNNGGKLWAENNATGGATFYVELPTELRQDPSSA